MEEEDSRRTLNYHHQDASATTTQFHNNNNKSIPQVLPASTSSLPGSSADISASNHPGPMVSGVLGISGIRISYSQDSGDSGVGMDVTVLQPPPQTIPSAIHSGNGAVITGGGKPLHIKRGPGRPRKDGIGRSPKPMMSQKLKKLTGWPSGSAGRGIRGRKKTDERSFVVGGTNNSCTSLGELNLFGSNESPPRLLAGMDDTAESDSSSVASSLEKLHEDFSLFPEQWPGKQCALCNLGERSMLGQGELIRIDIPSGFDAQGVARSLLNMPSRTEKDNSSDRSPKTNLSARRQKGLKIKRLITQGSLESMNEPVDEIVGYTDEPELNSIFDSSSGQYYVHVNCALWCEEVNKNESGIFVNLEKEIVRAASQPCGYCGNFGAAIFCKAPGCGIALHVSCAAASGGFQDFPSRTTLCAAHIDLAVAILGKAANCTVCNQPGCTSSLLMCCSCNNHYHNACLALNSDPIIRAGWQCPACKVCQACRQPGEDSKLLPCDACDKVYHIFCLRPALTACPKYSWKCKMCRICTDCGARTPGSGPSSRWHSNFSVCDSCYQQRNKGLACPLCGKAYRHVAQKHMVQCNQCKKYVHDSCDPAADIQVYQSKKEANPDYEYLCSVCSSTPNGSGPGGSGHPRVLLSIKRSVEKDEFSSESSSMYNSFTPSQDSFLSPEDDSLPGNENSDLSWVEKATNHLMDEPRPIQHSVGRGKPLSVHFHKKKLGAGRPKSIDKQGTLHSASNKRQRLNELQRKRGPKPKIRGVFGAPGVGLQRPCIDLTQKNEEEPGVENRLVLCSSRDEFVLQQDVCVMCGAFGNDLEGRLISCAQCGQCYHPFCVNVKVTKVILQKGWRCLDCTVCEGCGLRHDEARLILCDDCDVSFHIYCMDPPLDYVPQGTWKCKWCVVCQLCGTNIPGLNSTWYNNYTLCGPCYSLSTCSACENEYLEGDLIIQCTRCDRWLHATCDKICNENEAEKCAEDGYTCVTCRPEGIPPPHLRPPPPPLVIKLPTPPRSPDIKVKPVQNFVVDGVTLTEFGVSHLKSLSMDQPKKKRKKAATVAAREAGYIAAIESVVSGSDALPEPELDRSEEGLTEKEKEFLKKKQKSLQKLGIGGFIVRMRGSRFKDEDDPFMENQSSMDGEKPKRKPARKKLKNKIVESFPTYLQEAFFGKLTKVSCTDADFISAEDTDTVITPKISKDTTIQLTTDELKALHACRGSRNSIEKAKSNTPDRPAGKSSTPINDNGAKQQLKTHVKIEDDVEDAIPDILPMHLLDNELVNTIMNDGGDIKVPDGLDDLADSALGDDTDLNLDANSGDGGTKDDINDVFGNFQFNLDAIETGLPSMDSKDVEDIFKGVLTDESQESQDNLFPMTGASHQPSSQMSTAGQHPIGTANSHHIGQQPNISSPLLPSTAAVPMVSGVSSRSQLQQNVQQGLASPINFPPPSPYHSEYSNSPQFSPAFSEPPSPWPTQVDSEQETPSNYSQRSILKWEVDEALGLQATISAVLYANTNHPELKREHPNWAERSKQIAKIWRGLSSDKRAPYLQKARENRAASRMQKSQQIPKESKGSGSSGKNIGSQSQSPETDCRLKMSPSSSSSCSASGSSSDVLSCMSAESSGSSHLSNATIGFSSCTNMPNSNSGSNTLNAASISSSSSSTCNFQNANSGVSASHIKSTNPSASISASFSSNNPAKDVAFATISASKTDIVSNRCALGDQQIRVLTPSEIMRTLPALSQENCSFNATLEQDKLGSTSIPKQPVIRGETPEERQWKQMQALRQQQQQQQQLVLQEHRLQGDQTKDQSSQGKGGINISPVSKLIPYSSGLSPSPRQIPTDTPVITGAIDGQRQPLQVSTTPEVNMPAPQSPLLPSPTSRQVFGTSLPGSRPRPTALEMPPPSPGPHFSTRPSMGTQLSPNVRPMMYSRAPYMQSTRPSLSSPHDPYANAPMTPQPSNDPYAMAPSTPRPEGEQYSNNSAEQFQKLLPEGFPGQPSSNQSEIDNTALSSPRPTPPQAQETKQHLRDLLQRQQIKKLEQEQIPPICGDLNSPSNPRSMTWSTDEWQRQSGMEQNLGQSYSPRHPNSGPNSPQLPQQNQFRHPLLPTHARMVSQPVPQPMQNAPRTDFRTGPSQNQVLQGMDPRGRLIIQQQHQRMLSPNQQMHPRAQLNFSMGHPQQQMQSLSQMQHQHMQQQQQMQHQQLQQQQQQMNSSNQFRQNIPVRNPLDPYDHLVGQQRTAISGQDPTGGSSSSMLAQQLGRPLNSMQGQHQMPLSSPPAPLQHTTGAPTLSPSRVSSSNIAHSVLSASTDHHELPESVTAELEKLEQEQHNEAGVEGESGELGDMAIDDDELLGMGADFNILEYADPELDQAGVGEKTNILDNLDLEEEKDEEKEDNKDLKRKEQDNRHEKREPSVGGFNSMTSALQQASAGVMPKLEPNSMPQTPMGISGPQSNYGKNQAHSGKPGSGISGKPSNLRPPQPPPPYPVPPPPYPGRPQIGIRNGGGISMQSMPSMVNMGIGLKAQMGMVGNIGLRQPAHHIPSPALTTSCNPLMPHQQRRTLLLQEQPLLLEDLLEQEKREQQRQGPSLMGAALEEPLLSDYDFERLKADVMSSSALPVSLSPPNVQGQVILPPPAQPGNFNRSLTAQLNQASNSQWQGESTDNLIANRGTTNAGEHSTIPLHPALVQGNSSTVSHNAAGRVPNFSMQPMPAPPTPPDHPSNDQERQMQITYEKWLNHQHHVLDMQLKYYETEVNKLRKGKKSLNSKQRQLKKNGNELNESDATELERIIRELASLQKHLDQSRKQFRQHGSVMQDYRTKQQKRQQMMTNSQGTSQGSSQPSPMGAASQSPMHSTPQSPILSPSPSMGGPVSSPLMQHHSPMASPLTPSPGPSGNALSQMSPRSSLGQSMHHLDDRPFSPGTDVNMRSMTSPQGSSGNMQNRMQGQPGKPLMRMPTPGKQGPGNISQPGSPMLNSNPNQNQNVMLGRGMVNVGLGNHHQQRPMYMDNQRMRGATPEQIRMMGPNPPRFQRGMSQELILRARSHQTQFQSMNQSQVPNSSQHFQNPQRVPFPNQSPTGPNSMGMGMMPNLRSPLPMNSMGGLNSPPGSQGMMSQNRVSPASSPMRRPSGSGSVGVGSPIPDRPQSVENPLTPRSVGSGPHTPSSMPGSSGVGCQGMENVGHMSSNIDGSHFHGMDNSMQQDSGMGGHGIPNYGMFPLSQPNHGQQQHHDYGGGGGGGNQQILPFPTFSWFDGPVKLGLRGGSPFSVVNGSPSSHSTNILPEQNQSNIEDTVSAVNMGESNHEQVQQSSVASEETPNNSFSESSVANSESCNSAEENIGTVKAERISEHVVNVKQEVCQDTAKGTPISETSSYAPSVSPLVHNTVSVENIKQEIEDPSDRTESVSQVNVPETDFQTDPQPPRSEAIVKDVISTAEEPQVSFANLSVPNASITPVIDPPKSFVNIVSTQGVSSIPLNVSSVVSASIIPSSSSVMPPSSVHQANVGVLGGYRPIQNQAVVSHILENSNLLPLHTVQSMNSNNLTAVSSTQSITSTLASCFVTDSVSVASMPSIVPNAVPHGNFISASVPLITVYSRPEMKTAMGSGNVHTTSLTAVLLTSPRLTTSIAGQHQSLTTKMSQPSESQNALLKQLLQNTGCASMNQAPADSTGFSLTSSFSKARPAPSSLHSSQLSEAASRIPQPTPPPVRAQAPPPVTTVSPVKMPIKIEVRPSEANPPVAQIPVSVPTSTPAPALVQTPAPPVVATPPAPKSPRVVEEPPKHEPEEASTPVEAVKESPPPSSSVTDVIEVVASDKNSSETTVPEKKVDDEAKKAKRRQYQAKKRQSLQKESSTPKKRPRKGSKLEEDYDTFMENVMTQMRQLPAVNIAEPELCRNYNICPIVGAGDYSKVNHISYDLHTGDLVGYFGNATLSGESDYYSSKPFGQISPKRSYSPQNSSRGFYNQEFASPRLYAGHGNNADDRSPTPFRDSETPDTIVSASSPELVQDCFDNYPGLKLIDEDEDDRMMHLRDSPVIPIFAPIPIRPVHAEQLPKQIKDEVDKENVGSQGAFVLRTKQIGSSPSPLKETGNVTVTLTLTATAAEDIRGVLTNLANVLSISTPNVFQVLERVGAPPNQKLGVNTYKGKDGREIVDIQGILNGAAKFCRMCDVVLLNNIIKKNIRDLPGLTANDTLDDTDELFFCSSMCFMKFTVTHNVTISAEDKGGSIVIHQIEGCEKVVKTEKNELPLRDSSRVALSDTDNIKSLNEFLSSNDSGVGSLSSESRGNKSKRASSGEVKIKQEYEPPGKKWKGIRYRKWIPNAPQHTRYKKPTDKEMTEMLFRMRITVTPSIIPEDHRKCMFCHQVGDCVSDGPGRLLNYDVDKWVHLNCALWSEEVYETENGALVNVESALKQSLILTCVACKLKGATVKCFKTRCSSVYHLGCAVKDGCTFYKNKAVFCSAHIPKGEKENELTTLTVYRRVYIQRDENRQVAVVMHHADQHHLLRVGSLIFLNVGQLLPHQLQNFHTSNFIYPIGYKIVRFYWSMRRSNKRCQYVCSIHEVEGKPEFRISPQEEGCKDITIRSTTAQGAWHQILEAIAKLRTNSSTIKVFPKYITGEDLFGLTEPAIVKVLESLPGIETLTDYHFKYGRNPLLELPLAINPTGCARSEPKLRTHFKRPHTQRTGTSTRTASVLATSVFSSSEAVCPYSKQFVHSKSSQYKKMKQDWRNNVYLARSKIQGLGLYAARDIERHTMVIEYIGEIIRSELAEYREKKYESQNRGIYMFRVDEDRVIDATLCGGLARYINHSCNPNCVAETVEVDREWRIIIFANRRISRGEELAYDYKFEFEDDQHKIQCFCGAPNCRQWMN